MSGGLAKFTLETASNPFQFLAADFFMTEVWTVRGSARWAIRRHARLAPRWLRVGRPGATVFTPNRSLGIFHRRTSTS